MDSVKIEKVIVALYEQLCHYRNKVVTNNAPGLAMYFCIPISVDNYGYEKDGNTHHPEWQATYRRWIHVILEQEHRAFALVLDSWRNLEDIDPNDFQNLSNHDTCWKENFPFWREVMKGYEHCYSHVPEEHNRVPLMIGDCCDLTAFSGNPIRYVRIKHVRDPVKNDDYFRKLTEIRPVKFSITVEE